MGNEDHPVGEIHKHVDDGEYHVVKFTRTGANSTIQVRKDVSIETASARVTCALLSSNVVFR